jgi:hypothetical protein
MQGEADVGPPDLLEQDGPLANAKGNRAPDRTTSSSNSPWWVRNRPLLSNVVHSIQRRAVTSGMVSSPAM